MHIVIASVGTRGDAQPYVSLGKELKARGHSVTVATHTDHRELVESNGLAHRAVCGSFRELMESEPGKRWLESGDSPLRYLKAVHALFAPLTRPWIDSFEQAIGDADVVLVHAAAIPAINACIARGLRYAVMSPFSTLPSGELAVAELPTVPFLAPHINRLVYALTLDQFWKLGVRDVERYLRERGVATPRGSRWREQIKRGVPHLHFFSEHVVPRPKDWPACAEVLGYCFLDAPADWRPPQRLVDFLASGPTPIYVGFGSMTGMQPERLAQLTRDALRTAKQRAVIGVGWGGMKGFEGSDDMWLVDDVPHDWLFPRVSAVVHHCGAGTTAAALRADRPSVSVPFFGDQPYWARRLHTLGVTPAPVPKRTLTADRLASAIAQAVNDSSYASRAAALGSAIRAESGAARAADRVVQLFAS